MFSPDFVYARNKYEPRLKAQLSAIIVPYLIGIISRMNTLNVPEWRPVNWNAPGMTGSRHFTIVADRNGGFGQQISGFGRSREFRVQVFWFGGKFLIDRQPQRGELKYFPVLFPAHGKSVRVRCS